MSIITVVTIAILMVAIKQIIDDNSTNDKNRNTRLAVLLITN